ncbi:MAG TPA: DUF2293 domain-containing protein [Thermoanaerobaculia bacterium]|jgi:hypothetical protein|nr:DUF2293 domain-containing protein [Thermoanaerobaculia bacterium]
MADEDILVFELISRGDSKCDECGRELFKGNLLRKEGPRGLCIDCADLGHLAFVARGDACITRRASKYSPLRAIVLRFSRSRKRYERQGILVAEEALARAEEECLDDAEVRERRREVAAGRRAERDAEYVHKFADEIRRRYPKAPANAPDEIAAHACQVHSNRIGRTARAKDFDPAAIDLAVQAFIRHRHTGYDKFLAAGADRLDARTLVRGEIDTVLANWRSTE